MYAGVDGNKTDPGQPAEAEVVAARRRASTRSTPTRCCAAATASTGRRSTTRRRAPRRATTARSASRRTRSWSQTAGTPTVTLTNPFPNGVAQPTGNTPRRADQPRQQHQLRRPEPHARRACSSTRSTCSASCRQAWRSPSATSAHGRPPAGSAAPNDIAVNINQLDPKYLALGARRSNDAAAEPVLRQPQRAASLVDAGDAARARSCCCRSRSTATSTPVRSPRARAATTPASIELTKRVSARVGRPLQLHLQRAEGQPDRRDQLLLGGQPGLPVNNYNYIASRAGVRRGQQFTTACYDPRAEYALQHARRAAPRHHRADLRAAVRQGQEVGQQQRRRRLRSSAAGRSSSVINLQSGFPLNVQQSDRHAASSAAVHRDGRTWSPASTWRPPGSYDDRLASADHPTATWINPAAFSLAPAGTFGNAPRTITDLRTPGQYNVDARVHEERPLRRHQVGAAQARVLNLLNRPNVRALQGANTFGNANFGQTRSRPGSCASRS